MVYVVVMFAYRAQPHVDVMMGSAPWYFSYPVVFAINGAVDSVFYALCLFSFKHCRLAQSWLWLEVSKHLAAVTLNVTANQTPHYDCLFTKAAAAVDLSGIVLVTACFLTHHCSDQALLLGCDFANVL